MSIKTKLKPFVPPVVLDVWRRRSGGTIQFTGDYVSWDAARRQATGYDSEEVLRRVASATRKVVAGEALYERDSVVFDHVEYSWPLLASLLQVALEQKSLRVIDFGGSLGSTWRQNRTFLDRLRVPVSWQVVEQEHFVELGQREFANDTLQFVNSIAEASEDGADVVLFASSLGYVPDPDAFLEEAEASGAPFLILERLPVIAGPRDRIAVQSVGEPIYTASYPVRIFGEEGLLTRRLAAWRLIETWDCGLLPDPELKCHGFFLEKR